MAADTEEAGTGTSKATAGTATWDRTTPAMAAAAAGVATAASTRAACSAAESGSEAASSTYTTCPPAFCPATPTYLHEYEYQPCGVRVYIHT
uniref:Uncharacterized protein n=1 Tax=Oryza nivara TaxID=4536 RepID=A0A0E0FGG5_ORYNI